MKPRFFICRHCGNIVTFLHASGAPVSCCGEPMKELLPGTIEAAVEKHIPVMERDGDRVSVTVGEVVHPMIEEHYITWIALYTGKDLLIHYLNPGDAPTAVFTAAEKDDITAFAYCNIHGLWQSS